MTPAWFTQAVDRLRATSDTPRLDAELLLAHAGHTTREAVLLAGVPAAPPPGFAALVARRAGHEPVAYLTGRRAFWTIELGVGPGVLIPRPDTETLLEAALAWFGGRAPARILDLGTGSGALLLAALAEWPGATGVGIDRSPAALAVAQANAAALGLADRAAIRAGDWAAAADGGFDLVLCNPPYIPLGTPLPADVAAHEPASALFAGPDGLADYRQLAHALRLPAGGLACFEIGAEQGAATTALFAAAGFRTALRQDLGARDRCLLVYR